HERRNAVVRSRPGRTSVVQEIAIGLNVDNKPLGPAIRETDPDRGADLCRRPERAARMTIGAVDLPEPQGPVLERVRCEDPVLALDHRPDFACEARSG